MSQKRQVDSTVFSSALAGALTIIIVYAINQLFHGKVIIPGEVGSAMTTIIMSFFAWLVGDEEANKELTQKEEKK